MSGKYSGIQTAAELIAEVQIHGLSLAQEDICRVQDIFGNTSIDELARLANDIGRNNANGEPDPKGSWSSGRKATQGTFYMIVSHIWNWEEVTRFWNLYTNPQTEELKRKQDALNAIVKANEMLKRENDILREAQFNLRDEREDFRTRASDAQRRAEEAEAEVLRLKAKMYDLLIERKEAV